MCREQEVRFEDCEDFGDEEDERQGRRRRWGKRRASATKALASRVERPECGGYVHGRVGDEREERDAEESTTEEGEMGESEMEERET